ncbi:MAG: hypothetical protein FJ206_08210 [Gemmatimonadetes bacterium]|nr:hypothetical protein [Gemmatimonadota bacterium]
MTLSCLSAPFRLLGFLLLVGAGYLAWINRDQIRRAVHRMTAEPAPTADAASSPDELRERARARLDSLAQGRVDSVTVTEKEAEALVAAEIDRRSPGIADSIEVRLYDGEVSVRGRVDTKRLPRSLGPVGGLLAERERVEIRGPLDLVRVGRGEWQITQIAIRGLGLPSGVWGPVLDALVPGATPRIAFPVDSWITGIRVTRAGAVLYGKVER